MELKERVENSVDVDWRIPLFRGYLEVKRKRNRVYNNIQSTRRVRRMPGILSFIPDTEGWYTGCPFRSKLYSDAMH